VKAVIALHDGAKGSVTPEDIVAWGRQTMASYKAPRAITFVESLPRSESNKISWRLLQDAEWS
jgi:fatty-acyl-CoA synthase